MGAIPWGVHPYYDVPALRGDVLTVTAHIEIEGLSTEDRVKLENLLTNTFREYMAEYERKRAEALRAEG